MKVQEIKDYLPGGYPVAYTVEDYGETSVLCPRCAREEPENVDGSFVPWEDPVSCDECGHDIGCAYPVNATISAAPTHTVDRVATMPFCSVVHIEDRYVERGTGAGLTLYREEVTPEELAHLYQRVGDGAAWVLATKGGDVTDYPLGSDGFRAAIAAMIQIGS